MAKGLKKASADSSGSAKNAGNDVVENDNMDKIRDILFGQQIRVFEKQFSQLEEKLIKETAEMREESRVRFDSLEIYFKKEVAAINERLDNESVTREEAEKDLSDAIKESSVNSNKKLGRLEDRVAKNTSELREQILEQSKSLLDEMHKRYEQISDQMDRASESLRNEKVDRSSLSEFFSEIAMRLSGDATFKSILETQV